MASDALRSIPYPHHRQWIEVLLDRTCAECDREHFMSVIADLYPTWPPARGFGPLGYEDVYALVRHALEQR